MSEVVREIELITGTARRRSWSGSLPLLQPGCIVIVDNLGSSRGDTVHRPIRLAGAKLILLPKHLPDLNPIFCSPAILSSVLRTAAACGTDSHCAAAAQLLAGLTPQGIRA
jgi:hypothetical protein